ncbi:uncharacterized protein [Antedon mediterranea]|uniref:uncharacterized protein n=1 Tax=Antedon mediterranea TaxID=105859 RepID=UPI003AF447EA
MCEADHLKGVNVFITHGTLCHSISESNGKVLINSIEALHSNQEEADTRMFLHAKYAAHHGGKDIVIISPDTDVFIIGLAFCKSLHGSHLYFNTGKDANLRTIHLQAIQEHIGNEVSNALIGLHCFTGCDSVSSFFGKGKVKAMKLVMENSNLCKAFCSLGNSTSELSDELVCDLETFVCRLYGHKNKSVNEVRYAMFSMNVRAENMMPPNKDALYKHIQRANYQASIHKASFIQQQNAPSPVGNGWKMADNKLVIDWMEKQPALHSILELSSCSCKKSKCNEGVANEKCCVSLGFSCTELCSCKNCNNLLHTSDVFEIDGDDSDDEEEGDEFEQEELFSLV